MQAEENNQHGVEEVVAKEGGVMVKGVNPGAVDDPETQNRDLILSKPEATAVI